MRALSDHRAPMRPTVNTRSLLAALLLTLSGAMPSQAGYSFEFNAGPTPGPGGSVGGINYQGPNELSGAINSSFPYGILGIGTPSNSGMATSDLGVFFEVFGGSGSIRILGLFGGQFDFVGSISNAKVGPSGGSFLVNGFLGSSAASFFGLPSSSPLTGVATIFLRDATVPGGIGNKVGSLNLTLVAGPAPEPASLILTGTGLILALGLARARRRISA
jgi:hypothetical protein